MSGGIGTYGEKTLHREMKWHIDPSGAYHEIPVGKYIADVKTEFGITEIQTQSFNRLYHKLTAFLPEYRVTLVYPIAYEKKIIWIDRDSGEIVRERRSPKRGSFHDAFRELYRIKTLLTNDNLNLRLVLVNVHERRATGGLNRRGYNKIDTQMRSVYDELLIRDAGDYVKMIPDALDGQFTSANFAAATGLNNRNSGVALNVLNYVGAVRRTGKSGRYILYAASRS